jgi:hypothetical protein
VHEPLRKLALSLGDLTKPTPTQEARQEAAEATSRQLLESYSILSDFTNLLIPGAVAIAEDNLRYTKGAFKEAVQKKAAQVKRWVVRRQRRFIYATVVILLITGGWHAASFIHWKQPFNIASFNPPIRLSNAHTVDGELIVTASRQEWLSLPILERQSRMQDFFKRLRAEKVDALRIEDETHKPLVVTLRQKNSRVLSFAPLPEEDPSKNAASRK